jgi:hypothetical protein
MQSHELSVIAIERRMNIFSTSVSHRDRGFRTFSTVLRGHFGFRPDLGPRESLRALLPCLSPANRDFFNKWPRDSAADKPWANALQQRAAMTEF